MKELGRLVRRVPKYSMPIPFKGKVDIAVKKGDTVKPGDLLFSRSFKRAIQSHYLPSELGVQPQRAHDYVARLDGEYVTEGEILAERLAGGGLIVKKIAASHDGIISLERLSKGYIDILSSSEEIEVKSDFRGEVERIDSGKGMYVATSVWLMNIISSLKRSAEEFDAVYSGQFEQLGDGTSVYTTKDLKDTYEGKIVYAGRFVYTKTVRELYLRGAELVVAYAMDYEDYISLDDPVILLGGFGNVSFDAYWQKAITSMFGSYGVVDLSKAVIMWGDSGQFINLSPEQSDALIVPEIKIGMRVMINDVENPNRIGKVAEVNDDGFVTVEFDGGTRSLLSTDLLQPVHL